MQQDVIELRAYVTADGRCPFDLWLESFRSATTRTRIDARLARVRTGHFGDTKAVGGGVAELRLCFGPGHRIYFGRDGDRLVILLAGGDKRWQSADIARAQRYWQAYLKEKSHAHD